MNIRKFLIITVVAFVFLVIIIVVLMFSGPEKGTETVPTPIPLPTDEYYRQISPGMEQAVIPTVVISLPPTDKVIINKVVVNNFFPKATKINQYGDYSLLKNEEYKILYEAQFNLFLISIISSPFKEIRKTAEGEFVKILGVTQADACKLNVSITTPLYANPQEAGKNYRLSFCEM